MESREGLKACMRLLEAAQTARGEEQLEKAAVCRTKLGELWTAADVCSANEEVDDIPTRDLQYLLIPKHMQDAALLGFSTMERRMDQLKESIHYGKRFLGLCRQLGLLDAVQRQQYAQLDEKEPVSPEEARRLKIEQLRHRKRVTEKLKLLQERQERLGLDEEEHREYYLALLSSSINLSMASIASSAQELNMLEQRPDQLPPPERPSNISSKVTYIGPNHQVEEIDLRTKERTTVGTLSEMDRRIQSQTRLREHVFRNRNPHTVSLEAFAEKEMQDLAQRTAREAQQEEEHSRRMNCLTEEEQEDMETYKDRERENWKDDHVKGVGNTLR